MKKILLLSAFLCSSFFLQATHIVGGEIRISPISGIFYRMELSVYRDITGVNLPQFATVDAFQRVGMTQVDNFTLVLDTSFMIPPVTVGCGSPILDVEHYIYVSDTVRLYPSAFNHPGGYVFRWSSCCRNNGVGNVQNSGSVGSNIVTMYPPVVDSSGNPYINSTPILNSPMSDFAIQNHPYYLDFGGIDPDGDSLSYVLYTPFNDGAPIPGIVNPVSAPYPDPSTQFPPMPWANCYNVDNQINGASNSNCTSLNEPDRLQINPVTGELTMVPGSPAPAYYVYGIWCREYRNGQLIGSVFRDFQISITDYQLNPNNAPQVHVPQLQSLATWNADTMIFTGSPVCVQLGVTDPDSIADIEIEAVYSDYDPGDLVFIQDYAVILNPDTFQTALCFQPDSFLPYTTRGDVVALNPGCFDLRGDTLPFYFKFVGYSNAGWGGNVSVEIGNATAQPIPLFNLMSYNPNPGGTWYDLDNSGLLNANDEFDASSITSPVSYEFMYVDQQPNYPPDSALLRLNFVMPSSIENLQKNEINLYPNPSKGAFTLDVPAQFIGQKVQVYSYDLRKAREFSIEQSSDQYSVDEDGLYFIRIGENGEVKKLIIQN